MRGIRLFLAWSALLVIACGGTGKTDRLTGVYYQVKSGDTLYSIAKKHQISQQKLAEINNIHKAHQLEENTIIFIPYRDHGAAKAGPAAGKTSQKENIPGHIAQETNVAKPSAKEERKPDSDGSGLKKGTGQSVGGVPPAVMRKKPISAPLWKTPPTEQEDGGRAAAGSPHKERPASVKKDGSTMVRPEGSNTREKGLFTWPVRGKVANRYGLQSNGMYYNHIKIMTKENAPISAAAAGTVIFSAPLKEFGETIIVKHDQRFATVYTHLGTRLAKVDHRVRKGEQIGLAGKTEAKNEGCVYFEIRDHNKSRNPLLFLP